MTASAIQKAYDIAHAASKLERAALARTLTNNTGDRCLAALDDMTGAILSLLNGDVPGQRKLNDFFGINGHHTWTNLNGASYKQANWLFHMFACRDLGVKKYRSGYWWSHTGTSITSSDAAKFIDLIDNYATPAGIEVWPVLLPDYSNAAITSEQVAYDMGYAEGREVATALKGRVKCYEIGNEIEVWGLTGRGNWYGDYDNAKFIKQRGILCGLRAGIKSIDTTAKIVSPGGTWVHTSFYRNLLEGKQPDGSTGHQKLDWDETSWHWYVNNFAGNDDIENLVNQGTANVLAELASWGKPIHITECGAVPSKYTNNETSLAAAITGQYMLAKFWSVRQTYNIKSVHLYQLADAAQDGVTGDEMAFGIMDATGLAKKTARYDAFKAFVAAHQL